MIALVENRLADLRRLCAEHNIRRLHLFGSAAAGDFTDQSDLDFLVEFKPEAYQSTWFYIDVLLELQKMFDRKIDLLDTETLDNPFLTKSVNETKVLLYNENYNTTQSK